MRQRLVSTVVLGMVVFCATACGRANESSSRGGTGGLSSEVPSTAAGSPAAVFEDSGASPKGDAWPTACGGTACGIAVDFAIADGFGCALRQDGNVTCWIGDPSLDSCQPPTVQANVGHVIGLIGGFSTILLLSDEAPPLELHHAYQATELTRKSRADLVDLGRLAVGSAHICGIDGDLNVRCVGGNSWGQLGFDDYAYQGSHVIPIAAGAVDIASDAIDTCALDTTGNTTCWGGPSAVLPAEVRMGSPPALYAGLPSLEQLTLAADRGCGVTASGEVTCWGSDVTCSTHRARTCDEQDPRRVPWLDGATAIALQSDMTCGILAGEITCELDGGLGNCTLTADGRKLCDVLPSRYVKRVGGLSSVKRLGAGSPGRCAQLEDGTLWCYASDGGAARPLNLY